MKTHGTLQVPLTIFLGTEKTNFNQIMCEKRDRSTPEVSVFGSENSAHPW